VSQIETYLDELRTALPPLPLRRRRIVAEIRDHLLGVAAEEREVGATPAIAEQRAVERIGPPRPLAAEFAALEARRGMITANRAASATLAIWFAVIITNFIIVEFLIPSRSLLQAHTLFRWNTSPFLMYQLEWTFVAAAALVLTCAGFAERSRLRVGGGLLTFVAATAIVAAISGWWAPPSRYTFDPLLVIGFGGAVVLGTTPLRINGGSRRIAVLTLLALLPLSVATGIRVLSGLSVPLTLWIAPVTVGIWCLVPLTIIALAGATQAVVASWST
jgi:hypothetical protein